NNSNRLPVLVPNGNGHAHNDFANERELLYKLFFDMKKDVTELKKMFVEILQNPGEAAAAAAYTKESLLRDYPASVELQSPVSTQAIYHQPQTAVLMPHDDIQEHEEVEESLNIMDKEKELILKALRKHKGKRKDAASDLGISERTLYRKLKEYDIND
ncbi:MAG TPA: helix-turn-helix domain-containing protein, partial [Flavihumibacter sp.]|nr:helix-turn-helix domain-containing protein [Flavihumibacter sp.]